MDPRRRLKKVEVDSGCIFQNFEKVEVESGFFFEKTDKVSGSG